MINKQRLSYIINNLPFAALCILSITLYTFHIINATAFLGSIVSAITLYYGTLKSKIESDTFFKDLFKEFNARYDNELSDLMNYLKDKPEIELSPDQINKVINYFNLCAEEYLWKKQGRIPNEVWSAWKAGIKINLEIDQIKKLFENETGSQTGKESYYGLYEELR